jgi:hypothetical protein
LKTKEQFEARLATYGEADYVYLPNVGNIAWHYSTGENIEVLFIESIPGYGGFMMLKMVETILANNQKPYHTVFGFCRTSNDLAANFYAKLGWQTIDLGQSIYRDGGTVLVWTTWEQLLSRLRIDA